MRIVDDAYNAWYWLTDRPYRGVMLAVFAVGCLLLGGWLAGCAPADAWAKVDPRPVLTVTTARTGAGTFKVVLVWRYQNDAGGAPDSVITSAAVDPTGTQFQSHRKPAAVVRDSFNMTSTLGVAMTGYGCARTKRRGIEGANACKQWAYTETDVPPIPPIMDSVTTVRLTMAVTTRPPFIYSDELIVLCPAVRFENNLVGWSSKPFSAADPNHTACITALRAKFPLAQRITSTKAQAVADSEVVAFTWEALDGGVIHPGATWAIFEPPRYLGVIPGNRRWFSARSL